MVKRGPAGRHPNSDIFLDGITVSRLHAQFRCVSGEFKVVDVGSLNGTYVNREPLDSAVLANGDEVQIGKFRLLFLTGSKNPRHGERDRLAPVTAPATTSSPAVRRSGARPDPFRVDRHPAERCSGFETPRLPTLQGPTRDPSQRGPTRSGGMYPDFTAKNS